MSEQTTKKEFKDTLNLPQTTLAMRANAAVREVEIQKFWQENNIYDKTLSQRDKKNKFVLHDGPPYLSSDKIHIGTALNKILKDIIIKYKSLNGFYAPYIPGYDAHGLPIENAVVKNIKGGKDAISAYELRQKCREFALKNLKGQEENFKRLGVLGDWEHPYLSIASDYEAQQINIFYEMYKQNYIQKGLKPIYWCASCETALAEAEVEYDDHTSTSIYVRFEFENPTEIYSKAGVDSKNPLYSVIWTTTPWTIPSNMAICLHADFEYQIFEHDNKNYIIASELVDKFVEEVGFENINKIGKTVLGRDLELQKTKHPMYDRFSPIILGDHVTLEAGTGSVHTAPGHGLEDWEVAQKYNIETLSPFDNKGRWTNQIPELEGTPYYKGNSIVIEKLEEIGALIAKSNLSHSYPHCWRCKNPVMYRATPQWFVKVGMFKQETLDAIKNVKWIPAAGEKRITNMVENRSDWCISRQRAWGVPIPVLYCNSCNEAIVNEQTIKLIHDKFEAESSDAWVKYEAKDFVPQGFKCSCGCSDFTKETDIMDVWFDSGISWSAVVEKRAQEFASEGTNPVPVEMYLEGSDQHRGWFQSSLLTSVATRKMAPYKTVLTHGFVMDKDGKKMSKSLGNVVAPQEITKVYGADVLRLWAASVDYRNDIKIGDNIIQQLVEIFKKTRNTSRFLCGNLFDFDPSVDYVEYKDLLSIDKFALSRLNTLVKNVNEAFENYEFYKYFQYLQNFAANDLSSFYLDIVKDRLYTSGKKSLSRRAAQSVMYETLWTLIKILVPVMPHQAEDIFLNMPECHRKGQQSVLLSDWVENNSAWDNAELEQEYGEILKTRDIVSKAIEPLRASEKKIVGSSLEVDIKICSTNETKQALIEKYSKELKDLYIVSHANENTGELLNEYEQDEYKVQVFKAVGTKCERCWKYRELNADGICSDCSEAIN